MFSRLAACLLVTNAALAARLDDSAFKQVAAPPSDITSGRVRLPEPSACATSSRAWLTPVQFESGRGAEWSFETRVALPEAGPVSFALLFADSSVWSLELRTAGREFVTLERAPGVAVREQGLDAELAGWSARRFDVAELSAGTWELRVRATSPRADYRPAPGWLIVRDTTRYVLSAHTSTLATVAGREVGIVAHVQDAEGSRARDVVRALDVVVDTVRGSERLAMSDDGRHADGAPHDGVFGALLPRWTSGDVRARVELAGVTDAGGEFARSVQLQFPMLEPRTQLDGQVATHVADDGRVQIDVGALALGPATQLHVSAEVWGTNSVGEFAPVCWLSRMCQPVERAGAWTLPLLLDVRWLALEPMSAPFALRNVRVQDPDTHVPYDTADMLPLEFAALPASASSSVATIAPAMLMAPASPLIGAGTDAVSLRPNPALQTLLLVHGYCSGGSIWPAVDFTAPKQEFLDPNQNRTHDQFAQLLRQSVPARKSFGVVAHSQGGPAALHLYTYYTSGLDRAIGARRIQSVASPYQGTPLASLGSFACGVNNDMTPAGSATWLAGIPTWARSQVWYWTTANSGSACNFLTGLFLTDPEDGTVEQVRGQLPGANSMGHVTGWCHTTGMSNPANYTDHARNALMNTNAAR